MKELLRSFGRALVSAFHPAMLRLTVIPFAVATLIWGGLLYAYWQPLIGTARRLLGSFSFGSALYHLFDKVGLAALHTVLPSFIVIMLTIPLVVITVLLLIAMLAMPSVLRHLTQGPYAMLEKRHGGSWYGSLFRTTWSTLVCLALMALTSPLWLIPPLFTILPPLLWGWLTYRVMSYDALAQHAGKEERRALMREHRRALLMIGIISALLGALPYTIWVLSVWLVVFFPFVVLLTIWLYAFLLVFTSLWFGYYCLGALQKLRNMQAMQAQALPPLSSGKGRESGQEKAPAAPGAVMYWRKD